MKAFLQTIAFMLGILMTSVAFGQTSPSEDYYIGQVGFVETNPANCGIIGSNEEDKNFYDDGGTGNYSANFDGTTTFCPQLTTGTKMSIIFSIDTGFSFDVHASDTIYIYDGPDVNSPLLGMLNNSLTPNGGTFMASWNNPSGCLTVRFKSDGANQGAGWVAMANCGYPAQPFEMHLEAFVKSNGVLDPMNRLNPIDTGYVDICFGDSVLFVLKPLFPNSLEATGYGYSQNINNPNSTLIQWNISDGLTYPNNDSIWFVAPTRNGFLVEASVRDNFPTKQFISAKVRVSQIPIFNGTGPLRTTICLGEETELIGGVTASDTVGVNIPGGTFQLGGAHAGMTHLPDGSGLQYTTDITIAGFPEGSTIATIGDLNKVCLNMEHSYIGDLEVWLECPTGQTVELINSYSPGVLPGGTSGGGKFLGHPVDNTNGTPGVGWDYCFSSTLNTFGLMSANNYGNTVAVPNTPPLSAGSSMRADGIYLPNTSFNSLIGCPVNGDWTIHVRDNIGQDDGYIFEWSLYFDASFFPGASGYRNTADSSWWSDHPSIISGQNDTMIIVQPNTLGTHSYVFNVIDNYGCAYDTTVTIDVRPLPVIFTDTLICLPTLQVAGTQTYNGGVWSSPSTGVNFSSTTTNNPLITITAPGEHIINFLDNTCQYPQSATVVLPSAPTIFENDTVCGNSYQVDSAFVSSYDGGIWSVVDPSMANFSDPTIENPIITPAEVPYNLLVTYSDKNCPNLKDQAEILFVQSGVPNIPALACFQAANGLTVESFQGGVWSVTNNPATPWAEDTAAVFTNPTGTWTDLSVSTPGTYTVSYYDNFCKITTSQEIVFPPYIYTEVKDTVFCEGTNLDLGSLVVPNVSYQWNTGANTPNILVTEPGIYIVTITNQCYTYSDTAIVDTKVCDITPPNVISKKSQDGNNKWFVQHEGIADFECTILNRWGNVIYVFNDVNGYWDGKDMQGNEVASGVYFYTIKSKIYGGKELVKHGFITVVE